jgi:hypothetical protein
MPRPDAQAFRLESIPFQRCPLKGPLATAEGQTTTQSLFGGHLLDSEKGLGGFLSQIEGGSSCEELDDLVEGAVGFAVGGFDFAQGWPV